MQQFTQTSLNTTFINSDPSQSQGFKKIYYNQLPFQINIFQNNKLVPLSQQQQIQIKVLLKLQQPFELKLELTGDKDIYFNFQSKLNQDRFEEMKANQNISVSFKDFVNVLIKNLNNTEKEPNTFNLVFTFYSNNIGKFSIIQKAQFKNYQIISLDFVKASDQFIRDNITYRYNEMKRAMVDTEIKLQEIDEIIKSKNPSLLLQIRKKMPNMSFYKK